MSRQKILVCVPTYNERESISQLIKTLFSLQIDDLEILIIDDASPDGTAEIIQELQSSYTGLRLLKRHPPYGRGAAGREAFIYALKEGYDVAVEMDADFSHNPKSLPSILNALKDADLAIGSRLVKGGSDSDRSPWRRFLTEIANLYARRILRLSVRDANSGYRAWNKKAITAIEPQTLQARGPAIVHETLFRATRAGIAIREIPIDFIDRKSGKSKLNLWKLSNGYFWILRLALFG